MINIPMDESDYRILTFRAADRECRALAACYPGVKFNRLRLIFIPSLAVSEDPDRDDIDLFFNVSGSARDLTRHGFGHESWWPKVPASGVTHRCDTEEFGAAAAVIRLKSGYRLQSARYADGMAKAAIALFPLSVRIPALAR